MAHWKGESAWLDEEDEFDPDYREDSEMESLSLIHISEPTRPY